MFAQPLLDLLMLIVAASFFALCAALAAALDRLRPTGGVQ